MKKTFNLLHPKHKYPRMVEASKNEVRKYIKRERRKPLPEGVDFWDFDCKFGPTAGEAKVVHVAEITKCIDEVEAQHIDSFYVEVLAKPATRAKRTRPVPKGSDA